MVANMLEKLWKLLAAEFPVYAPRAGLRAEIGEEAVLWLERSTTALRAPLAAESSYACGWENCARNVIMCGDGSLLGVCSRPARECPDEVLAPEDAFQLEVSARTLMPLLQRTLEIGQRWREQLGVVRLGQRRFGATSVDFVFVPAPDDALTWLDDIAARHVDRRFALVVFHRDLLPAVMSANPRVVWLALSDGIPTDRGLQLPLHEVMLRLVPDAVNPKALWPPYEMVVGGRETRVWYRSRPVKLRSSAGRRLLLALLRQAGTWLSREELREQVFPSIEAHSISLPEKFRKAKMVLAAALEKAVPGTTVLDARQVGNDDDDEGIYMLDLLPGDICWLSADLADLGGPRRGP
jgi:hypothetical protein